MAVDYIKRRILDNKAAQTEIQEHCCIGQTEVYKCLFHLLRTTLTVKVGIGEVCIERLGVFLLPPGWDASPSQSYPRH